METWQKHQGLKAPGEVNPEFARACHDYISQFHCRIQIETKHLDRLEFYQWCADHLGAKYKDWFVVESGTQIQKAWSLYLRSAKKSTFVRLKYNDLIIESVDINTD